MDAVPGFLGPLQSNATMSSQASVQASGEALRHERTSLQDILWLSCWLICQVLVMQVAAGNPGARGSGGGGAPREQLHERFQGGHL